MSHEVETMAYAGAVPWDGLGVAVSNDLTPRQMMQKAGLDWTVEKHDSFVMFDDGFGGLKHVPTGHTRSLVRSQSPYPSWFWLEPCTERGSV